MLAVMSSTSKTPLVGARRAKASPEFATVYQLNRVAKLVV